MAAKTMTMTTKPTTSGTSSTTTINSPLSILSSDTKNHVLNFLPLKDCLRYGQVCQQSLIEILPNLQQRRHEQFDCRYAYQMKNPKLLKSLEELVVDAPFEVSSSGAAGGSNAETLTRTDENGNKEQWYILPSVAERIEVLYRALPQSHFGKDLARELFLDVQRGGGGQEEEGDDLSTQLWGNHFHGIFEQLQSIMKAHKIHNQLLAKATTDCYRSFRNNHHHPSHIVSLDQYMGDVLIATILMGHSIANLVETGPTTTYQKWTQSLIKATSEQQQYTTNAADGYREWIFLHSTVLRMLPMKPEWLLQMKLLLPNNDNNSNNDNVSICGTRVELPPLSWETTTNNTTTTTTETPATTNTVQCIIPHRPFWSTTETKEIVKILGSNNGPGPSSPTFYHQTRLDDFGPLGPAFRGRDRVRTMTLNPGSLLKHLGMFTYGYKSLEDTNAFVFDDEALIRTLLFQMRGWLQNSQNETDWLLMVSKECYRNRPMTVQPPMVTIAPRWER